MNKKTQSEARKILVEMRKELGGRRVDEHEVNTVGKALYELAQVLAEIERDNPDIFNNKKDRKKHKK